MQNGYEFKMDALESDQTEFPEASEFETDMLTESPFDEAEEMELAAELLGVTDEAALDQFLGQLIRGAGQAVGKFVKSPTGRALGGLLKGAAKKALPTVGSALGTAIGGSANGALGSKAAVAAGRIFGLELEGLSPEDQEFETARRFVRFAGTAAKNAALAAPTVPPPVAARTATIAAAQHLAPGLLREATPAASVATAGGGRSGRWIRRGRTIIILNA